MSEQKKQFSGEAEIISCRKSGAGGIFIIELRVPENFPAAPGQFIILAPLSEGSIFPRPFSIVSQNKNKIKIMVKVVGENTRLYSRLKRGDKIMVSGPKGSPIKIGKEKKIILIGGGIGAAALVFLARRLGEQKKNLTIIVGVKDKKELGIIKAFGDIKIQAITETGNGKNGYATDLLLPLLKKDQGESMIIACGPKPMLKKTAELCQEYGNPCQVILEEMMACGTGSCKGCAVFGRDGEVKHVCSDGPAFDAEWVDWKKFITKKSAHHTDEKNHKIMMRTDLRGKNNKILTLERPLLNASGCLSVEALENGAVAANFFGALVTKGVTLQPKKGNMMPRVCETPFGMINSVGLENAGLKKFLKSELPRWLKFKRPVIVNISGYSLTEYEQLAATLGKTAIAGLEINISCPNIKGGGMAFGTDPLLAAQITKAVCQAAPRQFIIVKLSPNVTDIVAIAKAVAEAGADAISLVNTFQAMDIDVVSRRPKIGMITGGLSGPAITPIALRLVHQLRQAKLPIPIIGMGGIDSAETAAKFFIAGADAVAIGAGSFSSPQIFQEISLGLEKIIRQQGFNSIAELTGSLIVD